MPTSKKAKLRREADKLFKEAILLKADYKCEVCNSQFGITAHHFIPRSLAGHLMYYLPNGVCLCRGCHFAFHKKSDPTIVAKIIEKRGRKWLTDLEKRKKEKHYSYKSIIYYETIINQLNAQS